VFNLRTFPTEGKTHGTYGRTAEPAIDTWTVLLADWLLAVPRRLCDRLFGPNDTEAYWRGWQITKVHCGLGRRYRDPMFDTLIPCHQCGGSGLKADELCLTCFGTGLLSIEEVS
jgi:hypothetical protein